MRGTSAWRGVGLAVALTLLVLSPTGAAIAAVRARAARGPAPQAERLGLVLPLVSDQRGLVAFTRSVTNPSSPFYGRYASIAELSRRFGATPQRRARVLAFLQASGATGARIDATGLFAEATMTVARAQRVFGAPLARFHAARGGLFTAPAASVQLPSALHGVATGVIGLDTEPVAVAPSARAASGSPSGYFPATGTPSGCAGALSAGGFTPSQYLTAYGYAGLHQAAAVGQGERVALIEIDGFRKSDIATFAQCFGLRLPQINPFGVGIGQALPPGGESTLDIEVLDAAAPGLRSIDVYESGYSAADVLKALTAPLQNPGFKPQVISASLGLCEQDTEASAGPAAVRAAESALEEAAASGISFLAASGDDGSSDCVDGAQSTAPPVPQLAVNYPASSPWVTGVGGTNVALKSDNTIESQTVWNDGSAQAGAGGGGFSQLFSRPAYQNGTVVPNRRAVPDVALLSDIAPGYDVFCSASPDCVSASTPNPWQTVGGTSAATPLLAGGLALIDQQLQARGQQNLGLTNPLLYAIGRNPAAAAATFDDVTTGGNDLGPYIGGFNRPLGCCSATPGFDEASGWGGVNLSALAQAALARQPKIVTVALSIPGHQRPVAHRHLVASVACSGPCLMRAAAAISIGRTGAFTVSSRPWRLAGPGRATLTIAFSRSQLGRLRAALRRHERIRATVTGEVLSYGDFVQGRSPARRLTIRS